MRRLRTRALAFLVALALLVTPGTQAQPVSASRDIARLLEQAQQLLQKNDYRGAVAALDKAIELDPRSASLRMFRGDVHSNGLHDRTRAMEDYRAAIAIDPNQAAAHYALGGLLAQSHQYAEAKPELVRATELAPNNPLAWTALGGTHAALGDNAAALAAYDAALKLSPSLPTARAGRADILVRQGRLDAAIDDYEEALKKNPRATWLLVRLGTVLELAHRTADAEKRYRAALDIEPRQPVAANNLAFLLANEKRDLDEALRLAQLAVDASPPSIESTWDTLAWVRHARGELAEALKILEPLAKTTRNPRLVYHLGVVYADMGRKQDALEAFDHALKLAPDDEATRAARDKLSS
jgi:tetratricopeptide (TPR) repeat protein